MSFLRVSWVLLLSLVTVSLLHYVPLFLLSLVSWWILYPQLDGPLSTKFPWTCFFNIMRVNYVVPLVVTVAGISLIPSAQAWGAAGDHLYLICVHKTLTASRSRNGSYDRPNSSGESYTNSQLLKPIWGPAAPECTSQTLLHSQLYFHKP